VLVQGGEAVTIPPGFLAAILEAPEDDVPRLILADYLEERNAPGDEWRATLIRVQLRLAVCERMPDRPTDPLRRVGWLMAWHRELRILQAIREDRDPCDCELCLRQREKDLLETLHRPDIWIDEVGIPLGLADGPFPDRPFIAYRSWPHVLRRGFVDEVTLPARAWVKYGPGLLRVQPVQKVVLTGALTHPSHLKWWHGRVVPYDPPCPLREIILRPHDATSPWGDTFRYQFLRSYIALPISSPGTARRFADAS
jgi:uncharacterized protein (TIGR02996 family)